MKRWLAGALLTGVLLLLLLQYHNPRFVLSFADLITQCF